MDHAGAETAARKLAEELGYLPLALEQAIAYIIELRWSFDTYRERLRNLLDRLACSTVGNSINTSAGLHSPSKTSVAPPRTRNLPPYFLTEGGIIRL